MSSDRLYVVVRADLPIGLQMAQCIHVGIEFERYSGIARENVVVLHCESAIRLHALLLQLERLSRENACGLAFLPFYEPDLDMALTAIAADGCPEVKRILRAMPLAFSASRGSSGATCRMSGSDTAPADAQT